LGLAGLAAFSELSEEILFNPGMGLYLAGGSRAGSQPSADAWALSLCDILYFRPGWNDLEADGPQRQRRQAVLSPVFPPRRDRRRLALDLGN
jgi:hypothetical protein